MDATSKRACHCRELVVPISVLGVGAPASTGGGSPLPAHAQAGLEQWFGRDAGTTAGVVKLLEGGELLEHRVPGA
jgi:hypothetical protein